MTTRLMSPVSRSDRRDRLRHRCAMYFTRVHNYVRVRCVLALVWGVLPPLRTDSQVQSSILFMINTDEYLTNAVPRTYRQDPPSEMTLSHLERDPSHPDARGSHNTTVRAHPTLSLKTLCARSSCGRTPHRSQLTSPASATASIHSLYYGISTPTLRGLIVRSAGAASTRNTAVRVLKPGRTTDVRTGRTAGEPSTG